ncbi:MAG: type II restriction endonuclease subunit M [Bacteroidetes bacterium RIFCSPLOWO2_02_FULL_36_8]|nr:MAG: type II restriction endonuclease subunit M [Bacteroidetes bacterium RIFCSPLOWO2_02_FULL_36_8]OFY72275.1 MAG: type II restriction endonuclease subunit M [Bacteroidetes bacterium RIFCSPLOWO2_12_FULL_37_12]
MLDEDDYIALFENKDLEKISKNISKSSSEINRMLRTLDSQKRPVLLSALMICLYEKEGLPNDFKDNYGNWQINTIILNIPSTIKDILSKEGIDDKKIEVHINELSFIKTDNDLISSNILKNVLKELEENVIPLFNKKTNYDIIGKFYEEFLRYAGITNVKKGIILTPNHITGLFTELIPIKTNDVIIDICAGTGAFLITGMNKLIDEIQNSDLRNKSEKIKILKENQLIGFEKNTTMYSLAISNMLFRGDGKSKIFNVDAFSEEAKNILQNLSIKPTIGFINPPYGGKDNATNPTKKEIQFLENMLDMVSGYGIIIAPQSTFFSDEKQRNRILTKHTLKYVINMPAELFQPNAMTHTAIAVFETNKPHKNNEVIFYHLADDGLILSKNRGRTDVLNKWVKIKNELLNKIKFPDTYTDNIQLVKTKIKENDEWIIQAHSKVDYSNLSPKHFINSIKEFIIFYSRFNLGLLNKVIDALTLLEILKDRISENSIIDKKVIPDLTIKNNLWADFKLNKLFSIQKGERLTEVDRIDGNTPLITASAFNNGITGFIDENIFMETKKVFENRITIDMFCNVFYHTYKYFSDDNIHTLSFINHDFDVYYNNKYVNLFLVTILRQLSSKYDFGRQVRLKRIENEIIKLPVNSKQEPDFEFMENYIKSLPYSMSI